jgi:hypothetical protein
MEINEIIDSLSYCGLVCKLCHLKNECDGCRNTANKCPNHSRKWEGCYHRNCCIKKNINGCWECESFPCKNDMFSDTHDLRIRAFVKFIKEEGLEKLAECLIENEKKGIKYGYQKDYDFKRSEDDVLELLRTGKKRGNQ